MEVNMESNDDIIKVTDNNASESDALGKALAEVNENEKKKRKIKKKYIWGSIGTIIIVLLLFSCLGALRYNQGKKAEIIVKSRYAYNDAKYNLLDDSMYCIMYIDETTFGMMRQSDNLVLPLLSENNASNCIDVQDYLKSKDISMKVKVAFAYEEDKGKSLNDTNLLVVFGDAGLLEIEGVKQ